MSFNSLTTSRPHYFDAGSLDRLPHVAATEKGGGRFWNPPKAKDYTEGCDIGREMAAHYLTYLHDRDNRDGMGIGHFQHIILAMLEKTELDEGQRGIVVGFGSFIDYYVTQVVRIRDPWAAYRSLEQYWTDCQAMEKARGTA